MVMVRKGKSVEEIVSVLKQKGRVCGNDMLWNKVHELMTTYAAKAAPLTPRKSPSHMSTQQEVSPTSPSTQVSPRTSTSVSSKSPSQMSTQVNSPRASSPSERETTAAAATPKHATPAGPPFATPPTHAAAAPELTPSPVAVERIAYSQARAKSAGRDQILAMSPKEAGAKGLASSSTHLKEWKEFTRAGSNPKVCPESLVATFAGNKNDLFCTWLANEKNLEKCAIIFSREVGDMTTHRNQLRPVKRAALVKRYKHRNDVEDYVTKICNRLEQQGLSAPDPLAPTDKEETMYYLQEQLLRKDDFVRNTTKLEGSDQVDSAMLASLTAADGLFSRQPTFHGMADASTKRLYSLLDGDGIEDMKEGRPKAKAKGKGRAIQPPGTPAERKKPTKPIEIAQAACDQANKEAQEARGFATALEGMELSETMVTKLRDHATQLELTFKVVQKLIMEKVNEASDYAPHMKSLNENFEWYKTRRAVARTMSNAAKHKKEKSRLHQHAHEEQ